MLIARNIAELSASLSIPRPNDPLYGEFIEFLKNKKGNIPSYANALNEEENKDLQEYHQSPHKEKIIFLEYQDVMRYFDSGNDPWILMSRYLDNAPYAAHAYKGRAYYENILKFTGSIEVIHFTAANSNIYNFSKVLMKQIIYAEEWGLSALKEREFIHLDQKIYKWSPEVNYASDQMPHLQRTFFTKFWKKMLQKDMETGEINSKETLELIKRNLTDYQAQAEFRKEKENPTPCQRIMNKLKSQGRNNLSKEEILEEYLKEMKEDLVRNFEYQKSDSLMKASSEDENQFNCLAGES
nr:hypothetical protein [Tanacetum cinerariifolium]